MEKIDSFNVMDDLKTMYVFNINYHRPLKGRCTNPYPVRYHIVSSSFNFKETCLGAMHHEIDVLKAKGMVIDAYHIEVVLASDTEKQF